MRTIKETRQHRTHETDPTIYRQIGTTVRALAVSPLMSLAMTFSAHGDTADVCRLFTPDADMVTQTLHMQLEDVRHALKVPKIYFEDRFDRVDGAVHQGQLFSVMNDDFTPVTRPDTAKLMKAKNYAFMTFVLHDKVPLDRVLGIAASGLDRKVGRDLSNYDYSDAAFGLTSVQPKRWRTNPYEFEIERDVYVSSDINGEVSTMISCLRNIEAIVNPGCTHDFRAHGIDVGASYDADYLADWQKIQTDISDFIGCATSATDHQD